MKNCRLKWRLLSKMNSFDYNSMKLGHIIKYHNVFKFQNGPYRIMPSGVIALCWPGRVAQSVTCLATDACLTAIPGSQVRSRPGPILSWRSDHEIISTVILLPSAGCCQLQAKVCARITGYPLVQACPGKSVVRWTDRPAMTIASDLGRKATKQTNKLLPFVNENSLFMRIWQ